MFDPLDELVPDDPHTRAVLALLAGSAGLPAVAYGVFVGLLDWPVQQWLYWGEAASVLILLLGALGLSLAISLARDVARRARTAETAETVGTPATRDPAFPESGADGSDAGTDSDSPDPITELQRQYVNGDLTDEEFDRRMDRLLELDEAREAVDERELDDPATE